MALLDDNKYVITNLDSVINVNSLVAVIKGTHNSMDKSLTFFHNFWQLIYCQKGECTWNIDGELYKTKRDSFIITPPHTVRKYEESTEGTEMYFISFYSNSVKLKDMQKTQVQLSTKLKRKLISAISDIRSHFQQHLIYLSPKEDTTDVDLQRIKCKLERFLLDLYVAEFNNQNNACQQKTQITQDEYFAIVITYLQNNISRNLTISDIVKETGIGRSTLENIFQKKEGVGVKSCFIRMKIDVAKEMIIEKSHSMTDIAQTLGFSSVHSFSRTFKAQTGASPKEYQSYF